MQFRKRLAQYLYRKAIKLDSGLSLNIPAPPPIRQYMAIPHRIMCAVERRRHPLMSDLEFRANTHKEAIRQIYETIGSEMFKGGFIQFDIEDDSYGNIRYYGTVQAIKPEHTFPKNEKIFEEMP